MYSATTQQPVNDEYGELIGFLETTDGSTDIRVLDADRHQVATTQSITTGKRHLMDLAFTAKHRSAPVFRRW